MIILLDNKDSENIDIQSQYSRLENKLAEISEMLNTVFYLEKPDIQTQQQKKEYRKSILQLASSITDKLDKNRNKKYFVFFIITFFLLINIFSIILYILILEKNFSQFVKNVVSGIHKIANILNFQNEEKSYINPVHFAELETFNKILKSISDDILRDRDILEIDIHGNLDDFLLYLYKQISEKIKCDRIALAFIDKNNVITAETAYANYKKLYLEPGHSENISKTSLQKVSDSKCPRIINNLEEYSKSKNVSKSTAFILKEGINSNLTIPMYLKERCIGFLFIASKAINAYNSDDADFAQRITNILKQKFYIEYLVQEVIAETSNAFITLMHEKDNETSHHITRMTEYSHIVAKKYYDIYGELSPRILREIQWFAALHDIGKIGIPDNLLSKNGKLDFEEMEIMKTHVNIGNKVLQNMDKRLNNILNRPVLSTAIDITKNHHEKYNGEGYPDGLKGKDIPITGRIVAVADVFDALTSSRPYKKAYSVDKSIEIMETDMKGHFDPDIFSCFKKSLPEILEVYDKYKEI